MGERCIWSHRRDPGTREVTLEPASRFSRPETVRVCPAHEPRLRAFHAYSERYGGWFLALFGLLVFAALMLTALGVAEEVVAGGLLVCFGALMQVFPFATPQTVRMMGVRASVLLVRVGGVAMLGYGVYLLAVAFSRGSP